MLTIKNKYSKPRRSEIIDADAEMDDEDLIPVEDIMISLSNKGYVKRLNTDTYEVQNRGGKGIKGMSLNENDSIEQVVNMSTHDYLLLFTDKGRVFRIKGFNIPNFSRTSKGIPIINLVKIDKDEKIRIMIPLNKKDETLKSLFFVTKNGIIKRTEISEFDNINKNGKKAIILRDDDELAFVKSTNGQAEIIIAGTNGKAVHILENKIRLQGRNSMGIKGFNTDGSQVIGVGTSLEGKNILTITENGIGKISPLSSFRITNRGSKGVIATKINDKTGKLIVMKAIQNNKDVVIMTESGIVIRIASEQISESSRNSQGVRLIKVDNDKVSSVAIVDKKDDENFNDNQNT